MPQPFWRRRPGLPEIRLLLVLALEVVVLIALLLVMADLVIPLVAPHVEVPTPPAA